MKFYKRFVAFKGEVFHLHPLFGFLLCNKDKGQSLINEAKDCKALGYVLEPFSLQPNDLKAFRRYDLKEVPRHILWQAKILKFLARRSFLFTRLYVSLFRPRFFENAQEASFVFRRLYPKYEVQKKLCLARALFAATTSKSFKQKEGAVFIGAFLPSTQMHAWAIEGDKHADPYDELWTDYEPIAILR